MKTKFTPLLNDIHAWPIYKFYKHRDQHIKEVNHATLEYFIKNHSSNEIDQIIARTLYLEKIRIKLNAWKIDPPNEMAFFRKIQREYNELQEAPDKEQQQIEVLKKLINRYSNEIPGNFIPETFQFARRILNIFFNFLLPKSGLFSYFSKQKKYDNICSHIILNGRVEETRALFKDHNVVFVPTHSSNLDSVLVGYALDYIGGIPAFSYGAGLNLFNSEFFAFFMNRLGAYKLDRRKKNPIYLQTLNVFSRLTIEEGVNTIFFPGGTRSRSGEVEMRVKLGLLNSVVLAQRELIMRGSPKKIIIVPMVLGYHTVLEGRSLIHQHLRNTGEEKYSAPRETKAPIMQYINLIRRIRRNPSKVYLTFGAAVDVFGNLIDQQGRSLDKSRHEVNLADYFMFKGEIIQDSQRESIYTKELGDRIVEMYKKYNYITPSAITAFAAFKLLRYLNNNEDVFGVVQMPEDEFAFPLDSLVILVEQIQNMLFELAKNDALIYPDLLERSALEVIQTGVSQLAIFHERKPLKFDAYRRLISEDFELLFYYHNKLMNLELDDHINWTSIPQVRAEILSLEEK